MTAESLSHRLARLSPAQRALLEQRRQAEPTNGHGLVASTLAALGVTHVYGVPGQPVYETFAACARQRLHVIDTHHQHPAALMAMAHNYVAGAQRAVCVLSRGAPVANALTAAIVARDNCWPVVLLAGAPPLNARGAGYFMNLDGAELYRTVAKSATCVPGVQAIPHCIAEAFETAMHGRPGPVFLELPQDALNGLTVGADLLPLPGTSREPPEPDPAVLQRVADALIASRRPLLIAGKGARWTAASAQLRELVEAMGMPWITSPMGRGAIADTHPLCMNAVAWIAQSQADLVLLLGARLDWTFRYGTQIATDTTVIHVDIHAPELHGSARQRIGVHADAGKFLGAVLDGLGPRERALAHARRDRPWIATLQRLSAEARAEREAQACEESPHISPLRMAREIRGALPEAAITILDGNVSMAASERLIPAEMPASRLTPGGSGCLGIGVPYAIAAKLAHPERPVVAICGDFSFGLSVMEIETAVRHDVPIVVVIANNNGNGGSPRPRLQHSDDDACVEPIAMFQPGLRYDQIADVLGAASVHVERAIEIGPALRRAFAGGRPACIDIAIDPDAPFPGD